MSRLVGTVAVGRPAAVSTRKESERKVVKRMVVVRSGSELNLLVEDVM